MILKGKCGYALTLEGEQQAESKSFHISYVYLDLPLSPRLYDPSFCINKFYDE